MQLFVGNLAFSVDEEQLSKVFESYGPVERCCVVTDFETGESKGFGFVAMQTRDAMTAMQLNGYFLEGRRLRVTEAREQRD